MGQELQMAVVARGKWWQAHAPFTRNALFGRRHFTRVCTHMTVSADSRLQDVGEDIAYRQEKRDKFHRTVSFNSQGLNGDDLSRRLQCLVPKPPDMSHFSDFSGTAVSTGFRGSPGRCSEVPECPLVPLVEMGFKQ